MPFKYLLNQQAHEEYIDAYEWYEEKKRGLGTRFMNSVEKRLNQISENPEYFGRTVTAASEKLKLNISPT